MAVLNMDFAAGAVGGELIGKAPVDPLAGVSTDSRSIRPGQLFVALRGPNFDGHDYVAAALEQGATAALVARGFSPPGRPEACLLRVDDTLTALGDLAAAWRREHSTLVAAVSGSNGKTTTKEMLAGILGRRHRVLKTQGNLNNLIGLPLTVLGLDAGHTAAVLEMGMNAPGEIARLTEIAAPEAGLLTNVGPAHIGMLGSLEAVAAAKAELYLGLAPSATAVVNADDPLLAPWAGRLPCRVLTFGLEKPADISARDLAALGTRQAFTLDLPSGPPVRVRLAAPGRHNVLNALAAAATAWALGQGAEAIQEGIEEFRPVPGRLGLAGRPGGPLIINDTYNANPASVIAGLDALLGVASGRPAALILGDMYELGEHAAELHARCGRLAAQAGCTHVLALGEHAAEVAAGAAAGGLKAEEGALAFTDLNALVTHARRVLSGKHVVLVKGSRAMAMERVVAALAAEGEED